MPDGDPPPPATGPTSPVVACFLRATFSPLPPRWKQGRLQLDADGVRWGPGLKGREGGSLLPAPLLVQAVREAHGWEKLHIKAGAFQIVEVDTAEGAVHLALPRERIELVVDHIGSTGTASL
jgi:hypothetical protein